MREPEMTRSTTDPELDLCDDARDIIDQPCDDDELLPLEHMADIVPPPSQESAELANIANLERHCGNCETEWIGLKEQCKEAKELYDSAVVELRRAIRSATEVHPLFDQKAAETVESRLERVAEEYERAAFNEAKHAQDTGATPRTDSLPPSDRPESNGDPLSGPIQSSTPGTGRAFKSFPDGEPWEPDMPKPRRGRKGAK